MLESLFDLAFVGLVFFGIFSLMARNDADSGSAPTSSDGGPDTIKPPSYTQTLNVPVGNITPATAPTRPLTRGPSDSRVTAERPRQPSAAPERVPQNSSSAASATASAVPPAQATGPGSSTTRPSAGPELASPTTWPELDLPDNFKVEYLPRGVRITFDGKFRDGAALIVLLFDPEKERHLKGRPPFADDDGDALYVVHGRTVFVPYDDRACSTIQVVYAVAHRRRADNPDKVDKLGVVPFWWQPTPFVALEFMRPLLELVYSLLRRAEPDRAKRNLRFITRTAELLPDGFIPMEQRMRFAAELQEGHLLTLHEEAQLFASASERVPGGAFDLLVMLAKTLHNASELKRARQLFERVAHGNPMLTALLGEILNNSLDPVADAYEVLGIAKGVSFEEAKRAYRQRIAAVHPDRQAAGHADAAEVNAAWDLVQKHLKS